MNSKTHVTAKKKKESKNKQNTFPLDVVHYCVFNTGFEQKAVECNVKLSFMCSNFGNTIVVVGVFEFLSIL